MKNEDSNYKTDRDLALAQLKAVGFEPGDDIFIRFIHAKKGGGVNKNSLNYAEVESFQRRGYNVYFVVNGGGHRDEDVSRCHAIFFEHDNLDKDVQITLWQTLGLPEPTIQVDTGGKSIHSYWAIEGGLSTDKWRSLQSDLLEFADGDRSLKNPSRIMRLAGGWYMKAEPPTLSTIVSNSGRTYPYEQLRSIIPTFKPEIMHNNMSASSQQTSIPDGSSPIPLERCLTIDDRNLIEDGASQGERNRKGAKLARNLIGTSNYLNTNSIPYSSDPKSLFDRYCNLCSPPLESREADRIWKSATSDNPSPSLSNNAIESCVQAWHKRHSIPIQHKNLASGYKPHEGSNVSVSSESKLLNQSIRDVLAQNLSTWEHKLALMDVAKRTSHSLREVEQVAGLIEEELVQQDARKETHQEVDKLVLAAESSINIHSILPSTMSKPLERLSNWLNIRPEVYMTTLLTAISTLHKAGTELEINQGWGFSVTPNLYSVIVAESSQKKSPILKALISHPMRKLQQEAREEYKLALDRYQDDIQEWNSMKPQERRDAFPDGKPQEPRQKTYYLDNTTTEGLFKQMQAFPSQGLLYVKDEIAGLFKSANMYRQGRGSDEEDLLSLYDGIGITTVRSSGVTVDIDATNFGIVGGIQPGVLQSFMKDCTDSNGKWARFIFVQQPLAASQMLDESKSDLTELLASLYKKIDLLQPKQYRLSKDAFKHFCGIYNELEIRRVNDSSHGMRSVWGKSQGRVGKLAINLHVLNELLAGKSEPSEIIPKERIVEAEQLMRFYANQVRSLHIQFGDPNALAPNLAKILQISERKGGWIRVRDVSQSYSGSNRPKTDAIRLWFRELVAVGKGEIRQNGRHLEFCGQAGGVAKSTTNAAAETFATKTLTAIDNSFVGKVEIVDSPQTAPTSSYSSPQSVNTDSTERESTVSTSSTSDGEMITQQRVQPMESSPTDVSPQKVKVGDSVATEYGVYVVEIIFADGSLRARDINDILMSINAHEYRLLEQSA